MYTMRLNPIKFGEIEHLDRHHKAILQFIKNNAQCTENQVVKAMEKQKVCSKMTTLRKLDQLIEKQEIKDLLEEGGFHKFIINEHTEFNQIIEALSKIEKIRILIEKLQNLGEERRLQKHPFDIATEEYFLLYEQDFIQLLSMMLVALLTRTRLFIQSEKDAQILNTKSIDLLTKLYLTSNTSPSKLTDIQEKNLKNGEDQWWSTIRKIKSEIESGANKDDYKYVLESAETERDMSETLKQIRDELIKIVKGSHVFDKPGFK